MYSAQNINDEKDTHKDTLTQTHIHTIKLIDTHRHTDTLTMSHIYPLKHGNILSPREASKRTNNALL